MDFATRMTGLIMSPVALAGRIVNGRAARPGAEGKVERFADKLTFGRVAIAIAALVAIALGVSMFSAPVSAYALDVPIFSPIGLLAQLINGDDVAEVVGSGNEALGDILDKKDPLSKFIMAPFLQATAFHVSLTQAFVQWTVDTSVLTATFTEINPNIYSTIHNVHSTTVIPVANVVALIVFTIGLVKVFANSSSTEAGIDLWKVMLIFICYGGTLVVINASWEIMVALYTFALKVIQAINVAAGPMPEHEMSMAGIKTPGAVMFVTIFSLIMLIAVMVCCFLINIMLLARGIEIYLYACYSPIAFAFAVTEGGRQMTEAFLKRYAAVLLAGAIQMVLLMLLSAMAANIGNPGEYSDANGLVDYLGRYAMSYVWVFVCAYMVKKSTTLAKDIIGTN